MEEIVVKIDGKEYKVRVEEASDGRILVYYGSDVYEVETKPKEQEEIRLEKGKSGKKEDKGIVRSPLPGTIYSINVKTGDKVREGDTLIKLMAMKLENEVTAPKDGVVKDIKVKKGDTVNRDDILAVLE